MFISNKEIIVKFEKFRSEKEVDELIWRMYGEHDIVTIVTPDETEYGQYQLIHLFLKNRMDVRLVQHNADGSYDLVDEWIYVYEK